MLHCHLKENVVDSLRNLDCSCRETGNATRRDGRGVRKGCGSEGVHAVGAATIGEGWCFSKVSKNAARDSRVSPLHRALGLALFSTVQRRRTGSVAPSLTWLTSATRCLPICIRYPIASQSHFCRMRNCCTLTSLSSLSTRLY